MNYLIALDNHAAPLLVLRGSFTVVPRSETTEGHFRCFTSIFLSRSRSVATSHIEMYNAFKDVFAPSHPPISLPPLVFEIGFPATCPESYEGV